MTLSAIPDDYSALRHAVQYVLDGPDDAAYMKQALRAALHGARPDDSAAEQFIRFFDPPRLGLLRSDPLLPLKGTFPPYNPHDSDTSAARLYLLALWLQGHPFSTLASLYHIPGAQASSLVHSTVAGLSCSDKRVRKYLHTFGASLWRTSSARRRALFGADLTAFLVQYVRARGCDVS